jgi:hypothetical protein
MSHGHDHKEYKAVFGDVQKATKGLTVICDGEAPKSGMGTKQLSRVLCLAKPMSACTTCEHSTFTIRLKTKAGDERVACPRWESIADRYAHVRPKYEMVRREQCFTSMPYEHCSFCTNRKKDAPAEVTPGWWELRWKEY